MARMAPAWMTTLNSSERSPSQCSAISRCAVLETGRNSVMPSMMPRYTVLRMSDTKVLAVGRHGSGARMLQRSAQILEGKACQRAFMILAEGHDFEGFAHLSREQQLAGLTSPLHTLQERTGLRGHILDAGSQQECRLCHESQHFQI